MATLVDSFDRGISAGRVFELAFATFRNNPYATIGLAILLGTIPALTLEFLVSVLWPRSLVLNIGGVALPGSIALFLVKSFYSQLIGVVLQGALISLVVAESAGRKGSFAESLAAAGRCLLPLLALGALTGVCVELGTTLLVIPAFIVYVLWSVAPSALVQEGEGVLMAVNRSQELSEGGRWRVVGILLVPFVTAMVLGFVVAFLSRSLGITIGIAHLSIGYLAIMATTSIIAYLLWALVQAALYVELRRWKEGDSVENLEQVFA